MLRRISVLFIIAVLFLLPSCQSIGTSPDYSDPDSWAYLDVGEGMSISS